MKIAKIIDTRSIVINAGVNEKIKIGDQLQIVGSKGPKVKDPDTGKELGTLDAIKGKVVVTQVYAHMAIAESIKYRDKSQSTPAILQNAMPPSSLQDIMYGPEVQRDLHVDMNEITGGYEENDDPIRVGDIVEKI
jgi:hypothetical protein